MLPRLAARHALAGRGELYALLVAALGTLLDGRRRGAADALALGVVDEVAPADALSHALGIARRVAEGTFTGLLWSPLGPGAATLAFPNVERDEEIRRLLAHHAHVPRTAAAQALLEAVRVGFTKGLDTGLAVEAAEFGRLVASPDGRAGIDRFLARAALPLPPRRPA
jgi:enoyl-CoA hydratase/carnithine racemase